MNKVVLKIKNIRTQKNDVLVKTGDFENTSEGVLEAFKEGIYDKYALVLRVGAYIMRGFYIAPGIPTHSTGAITKETTEGDVLDTFTFKATFISSVKTS
jgi:hypothetical protein